MGPFRKILGTRDTGALGSTPLVGHWAYVTPVKILYQILC